MAPINKNPNMTKKQTGTVPKTTASSSISSTSTKAAEPPAGTAKHSSVGKSPSSRKNTEIVVPVRREIKDLNDYFLSVAETTKQQNSGTSTHLDTTCFDLDNLNFQENQRFCWPVRPIPRRNIFNKDLSENQASSASLSAAPTNNVPPTNYHLNNNSSGTGTGGSSSLNSAAAVGVVIPTTPNTTAFEDNYNLNRINVGSGSNLNQQHLSAEEINSNQQNIDFDSALTWEQRLKFIQYFLSLTSKSISKGSKDFVNKNKKMVNERKENEILVNSASLEDVAPSETSDTRAQSVTSIHMLSGPTTPTYEELHSKLEASNRNIQNIKDQQQQLLKLQQAAKQHLAEMEQLQGQAKRPAHFNQNGSAPPDYESVEQVHNDMSNLVNRMKNLTSFIQGQHELSSLLGEDGPEILAEQEALQKKLEDLKAQRQEMKNLVSELQDINNSVDKSIQNQNHQDTASARVVPIEYQRVVPIELVGSSKSQDHSSTPNGNYQQQSGLCNGVVNGVHNGTETSSNSEEAGSEKNEEEVSNAIEETTELIQQKMADINAMKNQLRRLKEMMDTVRMIEEKTEGKSPREIGIELGDGDSRSAPKSQNTEPLVSSFSRCENDEILSAEEEAMTEKVRMLHEMTQDLREQAASMASERDRLKAIKDEMKRQKDQLEQKNRDESTARIVNNIQANKEAERDLLKAEYEAKQKEFEKLCERLQSEDHSPRDGENEDDTHENETVERTESKREQNSYFTDNWRRSHAISANSPAHGKHSGNLAMTPTRGKDSADSGAADVHGVASLEAGSLQSGSSRSFSMPPPMRNLTNREAPWRKASHDNSQFDPYSGAAPQPAIPVPNWNPFCHYNMPCSQHCHHGNSMSDCVCSHQIHSNLAISSASNNNQQQMTTPHSGVTTNDPMLLQQFIQTQQMLINSVCQCNQLLWHQQREINNLNNAVLLLQERLLNPASSNNYDLPSIGTANRAESVPPAGVTVANNLYATANRATSEQSHPPLPFQTALPPMSPNRSHFHNYNYSNTFQQHRRNINNIQHNNHLMSSHAAYNFASAEQGSSMYTANNCSQLPPLHNQVNYNNAQQMQQQPGFLNNDGPHQHHPAPPIFMHHHNNTITPTGAVQQSVHPNNNSNLLSTQQNCLSSPTAGNGNQSAAANAPSSAPNTSSSNAAAAAAALNNQVPPGNRANNYWDNFRR